MIEEFTLIGSLIGCLPSETKFRVLRMTNPHGRERRDSDILANTQAFSSTVPGPIYLVFRSRKHYGPATLSSSPRP